MVRLDQVGRPVPRDYEDLASAIMKCVNIRPKFLLMPVLPDEAATAAGDSLRQGFKLWHEVWSALIERRLVCYAVVPGVGISEIPSGDWAAVTTKGPPGVMSLESTSANVRVTPLVKQPDLDRIKELWVALSGGTDKTEVDMAPTSHAAPPITKSEREGSLDDEVRRQKQTSRGPDAGIASALKIEEESPAAPTCGKRRSIYDWPAFENAAYQKLEWEGGLSATVDFIKADLERWMTVWCEEHWERRPSESTIRDHLKVVTERFEAKKAGKAE